MKSHWEYIISDYYRYHPGQVLNYAKKGRIKALQLRITLKVIFSKERGFAPNYWLRLCKAGGLAGKIARRKWPSILFNYGLRIDPDTVIGYGLYMGHPIGLGINRTARIGNNCNISQYVDIGSNHDNGAVIGDNVYIGPHALVIENVSVGDDVIIGGGAVIVKDVPKGMTVVGNPGRIVGPNKHPEYICNKWDPTILNA